MLKQSAEIGVAIVLWPFLFVAGGLLFAAILSLFV